MQGTGPIQNARHASVFGVRGPCNAVLVRRLRAAAGHVGAAPVAPRDKTQREERVSDHDVWSVAEREESAGRVLHAYRERRRSRRAPDTFFGSPEGLLAGSEQGMSAEEIGTRRIEIMNEAAAAGMSPELADMMYDIARDEGLDPALAFELVLSGLGVVPPEGGLVNAPEQPSTDKYAPGWVVTPPAPPDLLLRERTLRLSFRRLRALLEEHQGAEEALTAFAREPDVGRTGY